MIEAGGDLIYKVGVKVFNDSKNDLTGLYNPSEELANGISLYKKFKVLANAVTLVAAFSAFSLILIF